MVVLRGRTDADDLDLLAALDDALLDTAGGDGAATGDREDVLDRHEERLVEVTLRLRDVRVQRSAELDDLCGVLRIALERLQRRTDDDERGVVNREVVLVEQVLDLLLDELDELSSSTMSALLEHDQVRHADLAGEQDVLTRLRGRTVRSRHHEDAAVHLGRRP